MVGIVVTTSFNLILYNTVVLPKITIAYYTVVSEFNFINIDFFIIIFLPSFIE